jgi:hypothetical protein
VHPALVPRQAGQKSILVIQLLSFEGTWGDQNLNPTAKHEKNTALKIANISQSMQATSG